MRPVTSKITRASNLDLLRETAASTANETVAAPPSAALTGAAAEAARPPTARLVTPPATQRLAPATPVGNQTLQAAWNWQEDIRFALGSASKGTALMMTIIGAIVMAGVGFASRFAIGPLGLVLLLGLTLLVFNFFNTYGVLCLKAASSGRPDLPDSPSPGDMVGQIRTTLACTASSLMPLVVVIGVMVYEVATSRGEKPINFLPYLVGGLVASVVGSYLYPMAVLMTTLFSDANMAFNYPAILRSIAATKGAYTIVFVCYAALNIMLMLDISAIAALPNVGVQTLNLAAWALMLHAWFAFNLLLGRFYRRNAGNLGWFETQNLPVIAAPTAPATLRAPTARLENRAPEFMIKAEEQDPAADTGEHVGAAMMDTRNRDIALLVLSLFVGGLFTKWEMRVWSAQQLIETKSYNMLEDDFAAMLQKELEVKGIASGVQKDEIQLLMRPGLTGKGTLIDVTIKSSSGGLYAQYEGPTERDPGRCEAVGFKPLQNKSDIWKLPGWRGAVRWIFMLAGLISAVVFLVKIIMGRGE